MNSDKQTRSKQPVQPRDARQGRTAASAPNNRRPPGDVITYQDSTGYDLETGEGDYDDAWPQRVPNSSIRYLQPYQQDNTRFQMHPDQVQRIPQRRSAPQGNGGQSTTEARSAAPPRRKKGGWFRSHPVLWLGVGMLLMLGLWQGLTTLGAWWSVHQDDVTYGRPMTAQYDVVVGHNHDSPTNKTHLIALNFQATVEIIEFPGGDSSKAKVYQGPHLYGQDADLAPVTLSFRATTSSGVLDMIVNVQGAQLLYLNKNGQFVLQLSH